jgi:hypothetical protein
MNVARAFEVYDEILGANLEGSIQARRLGPEHMDFAVTLSLIERTQEELDTLAAIVERYELELDVDEHRHASLR